MENIREIEVINPIELNPIDMKANTQKQLEELTDKELAEEMKRREEAKKQDRQAYKNMVAQTVPEIFELIKLSSEGLSEVKTVVFESFNDLLELKKAVYGVRDNQQSHTFTDEKGQSITIGYRVTDEYDDTVSAGIEKVNEFLGSLAKDEDSAKLVKSINSLLKKDAKGNLKASRVVELVNMADDFGNELFSDGVSIIQKAYKPKKSVYFIDAHFTGDKGQKVNVPLSISAAPFSEDKKINI